MTQEELGLYTLAGKNNVSITDIQLSQISRYVALLREWNKSINLVSRKDEENLWTNHILISAAFLFVLDVEDGSRMLDLGTGGGLPGIVLSIMRPGIEFVLMDSMRKKTNAVLDMTKSLGLKNATVVCGRAEELNMKPSFKNGFDAVIARSVARLDLLVEWGAPFLQKPTTAPNGSVNAGVKLRFQGPAIATMKGGDTVEEEGRTTRRFPASRIRSIALNFPGSEILQNSEKKILIVENV